MKQEMYIGPRVPGIVKEGTVFIDGLPASFTEVAGSVPAIKNLVIPLERITGAKQALSEQGSVENVSYCKVLDYLKGVK